MALTNKGFNGTVDEAAWARMSRVGDAEGVDGASSWLVSQGTGRQVSVAAQSGWAFAAGVVSKDTAAITANLSTPTNGQWFLIVRRIDWATDTVTVVSVAHTTTTTTVPTIPPTSFPTINQDPGVIYDQPLAWAWDRSTDTTVVLFDLRTMPLKDRLAQVEGMMLRNVADLNALLLFDATVFEGRRVHVDELNCDFQAQDGAWVQQGVAVFASTTARNAAYAKASAAFRVEGAQATVTATSPPINFVYSGSAWLATNAMTCVLRKSAAQNLGTSLAALTWDVEDSDRFGMHDNVTNNARIVAPVDGVYQVSCSVYNNNTSGTGVIQARLNGAADVPGSFTRRDGTATAAIPLETNFPAVLAAGDYIEVMVSHSTAAGAISGGNAGGSAIFSMWKIS